MTREDTALNLLRQARRALVDHIVDSVIEDNHLSDHGELAPFDDSLTDTGERLFNLNRLIVALEDASYRPPKPVEPEKQSNPWVSEIVA